ncbi:MAG: phage major capsid protein, partial [Tabrizicola sp.]|nr:phage major capsid protein [Tabrizicola sp.]
MTGIRHQAAFRGILAARAEANPTAVFAELQTAFEAFKASHSQELKGINAKFDDVVKKEEVGRIS